MPNSLSDTILRTQIHLDMRAAWTGPDTPKKIHDGRPRLAKGKADLPYSVVTLKSLKSAKDGLRKVSGTYEFELTYVAGLNSIPTGQTIETAKQAKANALIALLTAGVGYAGAADRLLTGVDFSEGETSDNEPTYEVTVQFQATVIDNA